MLVTEEKEGMTVMTVMTGGMTEEETGEEVEEEVEGTGGVKLLAVNH